MKSNHKLRKIDFSPPEITDEDIASVVSVLKSGWITTGPKVSEFEKRLKDYTGACSVSVLSSATAALELILRVLEIGEGDEVITTPYTFTASASVIKHVGASLVFADVDKDSFLISAKAIEEKITPRTKAVICVDYGGVPCDYDAIFQIVEKHKELYSPKAGSFQALFSRAIVIADASHSLGAKYCNQGSGSIADFSTFSFHAVKNLTTAEGGALCVKDDLSVDSQSFKSKVKLYSLHGQNNDAFKKKNSGWQYDIIVPGFKFNMTDMQAALGLSQLNRYGETLIRRKKLFERYAKNFADDKRIRIMEYDRQKKMISYHLFPVRINGFNEEQRDIIITKMKQKNIAVNVHFKPLTMMTAYNNLGFNKEDYPNSYNVFKNVITLPLHLKLSLEDIDYISTSLKSFLGESVS